MRKLSMTKSGTPTGAAPGAGTKEDGSPGVGVQSARNAGPVSSRDDSGRDVSPVSAPGRVAGECPRGEAVAGGRRARRDTSCPALPRTAAGGRFAAGGAAGEAFGAGDAGGTAPGSAGDVEVGVG